VQAAASGAKVIGLANAGTDLQNCIKQAAEFGIVKQGRRLATLLMIVPDVLSLGQDVCQGLVLTNSFYWDQSPQTRAWTERFVAKMGKPPTEYNAGAYAGVLHWLKAVKAANTLDADATAAKMRELPLDDFYNSNVRIMANGCVPHTMYLWEVKPPSEAKHRWDLFNQIGAMPTPEAYPPVGLFGCPLSPA
jgi:branched-chain amino acid transport system substrate-binding protein